MHVDPGLQPIAESVLDRFRAAGLKLATAESCTGGLISALLTSISGSSDVFERGFVTYSNEAKRRMIGVSAATLDEHGAVSAAVSAEMASGALANSRADVSLAVTGIAGPDGGSPQKPVGLVFIAAASLSREDVTVVEFRFGDIGRDEIRNESARKAMEMVVSHTMRPEI